MGDCNIIISEEEETESNCLQSRMLSSVQMWPVFSEQGDEGAYGGSSYFPKGEGVG